MSNQQPTGLGEPDPIGKKSLFQPPTALNVRVDRPSRPTIPAAIPRMRMTLEITKKSLAIMQDFQSKYRLETGHLLPKWKIISEALELYQQARKGEGHEKTKPPAGQ